MVLRNILLIGLIIFINSCASSSSYLLIGEKRDPIAVSEVKIYSKEPEKYDSIAVIDASSKGSFSFTEQQKMDAALVKLKQEAANLGANGIILGSVNDEQVLTPITQANGSTTFSNGSYKALKATAIYVHKE